MDQRTTTVVRYLAPCVAFGAALLLASGPARAAEPEADGSVSVGTAGASADGSADADGKAKPAASKKSWFRRYRPRRNSWEVGFFGGAWLPSSSIELHHPELDFAGYRPAALDLGVRAGYYPLRHFGLEGEVAFMPGAVEGGGRSLTYSARAHGILQLGIGRIVPFAVLGGGVLAVRSGDDAAGRNADEALHVGGGVKFWATRNMLIRLDVRDVMSPKQGLSVVSPAHNLEVLLGLSWALGPKPKAPPPPPDRDGDGVVDSADACPDVAGDGADGCPIPDTDDDGVKDPDDACPTLAGTELDGCPIPDSDGDGYLDPDDACPTEAGVDPDGCPIRDVDGDGIFPPDDACPQEPETVNGFEDADGCPDEIPAEVAKFTGVIEGIYFDTAKATIRDKSFPVLDDAAKVLLEYPSLRVMITGHTDDRGKHDYNVELSQSRAASVKDYLVGKGIDASRITTRGAGPDEPVSDNRTRKGRAENRRIEFKMLTD
ncbi:MAG: OmpA family protein [Deltaproteobacteria bacterium]|nr:OmpA family protein [Deltaproteobacteria bacterium]